MKRADYLALSLRGLRRGMNGLAALLTSAAAMAMCFSGAMLAAVRAEEAAPCELTVTGPGYLAITEQTVQDIRAVDGVVDATGTVEVPAGLACAEHTASLTLVGLDGDYLRGDYILGGAFPAGGAMPWLTLTRAAARSFVREGDDARHGADYLPELDWLGGAFTLTAGQSVLSARVSGLMEGEDPVGYMDLAAARRILQSQGGTGAFTGVLVRVKNAGTAEAVSAAVAAMGFAAAERDTGRQQAWDARMREAIYLAAVAAVSLACAAMVRLTGAARDREGRRRRAEALRWAGMSRRAAEGLDLLGGLWLGLAGGAAGVCAHYTAAALAGLGGAESAFALTLPPALIPLPAAVCALAGSLGSRRL